MKFFSSFRELAIPLAGKPALVAALTLMATIAAMETPQYGAILLIILWALVHVFGKFLQKVVLVSLLAGTASILFGEWKVPAPTHSGLKMSARSVAQVPPSEGCGTVESVLPRSNGVAFIVKATNSIGDGYRKNGAEMVRVRLTEKRDLSLLPEPGDSICYEAAWYPVEPPTVPGAFDTRKWLDSQGLMAYGKFKHWKSWRGSWNPEQSFFHFRNWIKARLSRFLDPAETGLLMGLLAGDRSGIPEALRSDFQRSGLVHVLAISGFHVVLLAGLLMTFLKATGLPHRIVRVVGILLLAIYVPVTGGSPAVTRAVIMFAVPQVGMLFQRPASALNSLGVALIFILLPNPQVLWNPGFQLSAAATVGIILGSSHNPLKALPDGLLKNRLWGKFQSFILEPTYTTVCATLATAPFLIYHFKTLAPLAWLGNIVIVPLISWGMEAGLFALMSPFDFLTETFCSAASVLLRCASLLTRQLSDSSAASVTVGPYPPFVLLLMGFVFALLPSTHRSRLGGIFFVLGILFFSCFYFVCNYRDVIRPSWKLTAIDIGQGDAILITTPSGRNILIDSGPNDRRDSGKDIIVPYLRRSGILTLDALVVTHADADHFGGALGIVGSFPVKELWVSECARLEPKPAWIKTMAVALERGIPLRDIGRGFTWSDNSMEIRALHPISAGTCGETNEESISFRVKGLGQSAILTGDLTVAGERKILKSGMFLKSDVLKLGHHGSKTSSSRNFLTAVEPKLALVSSGRKNRFHHPHKQVVERLDSLGIPYLNTANRGTITVQFTSDTMVVETMLPGNMGERGN
ncbi:MAG: DNA internalization-related competence protein ComEC/Rec2 [Fibrobacter sp.]|nr:DNA internalization-related competence protein ComEC/Rec2 [Fibrobacter sp.]